MHDPDNCPDCGLSYAPGYGCICEEPLTFRALVTDLACCFVAFVGVAALVSFAWVVTP